MSYLERFEDCVPEILGYGELVGYVGVIAAVRLSATNYCKFCSRALYVGCIGYGLHSLWCKKCAARGLSGGQWSRVTELFNCSGNPSCSPLHLTEGL